MNIATYFLCAATIKKAKFNVFAIIKLGQGRCGELKTVKNAQAFTSIGSAATLQIERYQHNTEAKMLGKNIAAFAGIKTNQSTVCEM